MKSMDSFAWGYLGGCIVSGIIITGMMVDLAPNEREAWCVYTYEKHVDVENCKKTPPWERKEDK